MTQSQQVSPLGVVVNVQPFTCMEGSTFTDVIVHYLNLNPDDTNENENLFTNKPIRINDVVLYEGANDKGFTFGVVRDIQELIRFNGVELKNVLGILYNDPFNKITNKLKDITSTLHNSGISINFSLKDNGGPSHE